MLNSYRRLDEFVKLCTRFILLNKNLFYLPITTKYAPIHFTSSYSISYSRGRRIAVQKNKLQQQKQDDYLKLIADGELYNDPNFDFIDRRKEWRNKKVTEKFNLETQKWLNREMNQLKNISQRNALYENDEDDLKLIKLKHELAMNSMKGPKILHKLFEKEQQLKQAKKIENTEMNQNNNYKQSTAAAITSIVDEAENIDQIAGTTKLKWKDENTFKKQTRVLIPLPYDLTTENQFDILNEILIPYYKNMPYSNQLKLKHERCVNILQKISENIRLMDGPIRVGRGKSVCPVEQVRPSPIIKEYRNKDEFSVWPGLDGNSKTVGFFIGRHSVHDRVVCVPANKVVITKKSHIDLANQFQHYLREVSPYSYCTNYGDEGHWRRFHIRSNKAGQHMVIGNLHPQNLTVEQLNEEMSLFRDYFSNNPLISSLYFHPTRGIRSTHANEPYFHLAGDTTIMEQLFDHKFVISPSSFFQVNTAAATVLYRVIMTELNCTKKEKTTLLDLCCGTGTLSVLMSDQVRNIVAIDSSESAVSDAKANATANNVQNVTFHVGMLEDILPKLIEQNQLAENVVAVVNPTRRGLHPNVIQTLRHMSFIQRLIYISCRPDGYAFNNFIHLCQPRTLRMNGPLFLPVNAVPVDLFPHTDHCELVITFERID